MKVASQSKIDRFVELVTQGVSAWVEAGTLLNEILAENPRAAHELPKLHPFLTASVLETFCAIGERRLYPMLVLDQSPGASALAALPYEDQETIYSGTVSVMVRNQDRYEQTGLKVSKLTARQVAVVFENGRIRTPAEQTAIMREEDRKSISRGFFMRSGLKNGERSKELDPGSRSGIKAAIPFDELDDASPEALLLVDISSAQGELMECRRHLAAIQKESQFDDLITIALTAIGKLRLAVNEGQIKKRK